MRTISGLIILLFLSGSALAQDSLNVRSLYQAPIWRYIDDIDLEGNTLFAAGADGIQIVDMSTLSEPEITGLIAPEFPGSAYNSLVIRDTIVYYAARFLSAYSISNLAEPELLSSIELASSPYDIICHDNLLFVATYGEVVIFDISTPSAPQEIGFLDVSGEIKTLGYFDGFLYVTSLTTGASIIDVTNPASPQLVGSIPLSYDCALMVADGMLYLSNHIFRVFDLSNPVSPELVGSTLTSLNLPSGLVKSGNFIYATDYFGRVVCVDVSNSSSLIVDSQYDLWDYTRGIVALGSVAYVAGNSAALHGIDFSDPQNPVRSLLYTPALASTRSFVSDNRTILVNSSQIVQVLDTSDPQNPIVLGSSAFNIASRSYAASENIAFFTDSLGILYVYDCSDPINIHETTRDTLASQYYNLRQIDESRLFLTLSGEIEVIDFSDPEHLLEHLGTISIELAVGGSSFVVDGNLIYVSQFDELSIYDITDLAAPILLGSVEAPDLGSIRELSGNLAYLTAGTHDLLICDVSTSSEPIVIGEIPLPHSPTSMSVDGNYLALYDETLRIYDVGNPSNPFETGYYETDGYSPYEAKVELRGTTAYLFGRRLSIYDISEATSVRDGTNPILPLSVSLSAFPNPFNPVTTIAFDLVARTKATIAVYNVNGQLVENLLDETMSAGSHSVTFDGSDFGSGAYFVRLTTPDQSVTQKMVLMK